MFIWLFCGYITGIGVTVIVIAGHMFYEKDTIFGILMGMIGGLMVLLGCIPFFVLPY